MPIETGAGWDTYLTPEVSLRGSAGLEWNGQGGHIWGRPTMFVHQELIF